MNAVQSSLSSPRISRIIFWLGAALLVAAIVVFVVKRSHGSSAAPQGKAAGAGALQAQKLLQNPQRQAETQTSKKWSQLDPQARLVVRRFIVDGAGERNLARAWTYAHPSLRAGFTREEWVHGNALPFQVFPQVDVTAKPSFTLVEWSPSEFLAQVGLRSTNKKGRDAYTFQVGAAKVGRGVHARWLINYWMPLYTPPVHADPSQSFGG